MILNLAAVVLAGFLSTLLLSKRNKSYSDYLLFGWIFLSGVHLLGRYLFTKYNGAIFPSLVVVAFSFPLIQGPFLFLYTRSQITGRAFRPTDLLHFVPLLISIFSFADFHLLPSEDKLKVFANQGSGYESGMALNVVAIYISGIVYIIISMISLFRYRKNIVNQFSNTEKIKLNWLLYLLIWIIVIWLVILVTGNDHLIFGAASVFIMWLGYFGIKQERIFTNSQRATESVTSFPKEAIPSTLAPGDSDHYESQEISDYKPADETTKYRKSGLTEQESNRIYERLKDVLDVNRAYKNPELRLDDLALMIGVHPNHLSQVINSRESKSFYDLVNELRIREFIREFEKQENRQFTILAVAFDCGFNSKTAFNRNFKKFTGYTPSEYFKSRTSV